jgi:hypothetical protein
MTDGWESETKTGFRGAPDYGRQRRPPAWLNALDVFRKRATEDCSECPTRDIPPDPEHRVLVAEVHEYLEIVFEQAHRVPYASTGVRRLAARIFRKRLTTCIRAIESVCPQ